MDRNQNLVTIAVDSHRVIVVLVFIHSGSELNVDFLSDASWNHAFLLASDLEIAGLRGQDVQTLWRRRVVDQSQLHGVRLIGLEASEFDNAR